MKANLTKITLLSLIAVALAALPAVSRAADSTNAPAAARATKHTATGFHGKVASVDAAAMTFTVGKTTVAISSETKISKDGKPGTFADVAVGQNVSGSFKKNADGKSVAATVKVGANKKKDAPAAPSATP